MTVLAHTTRLVMLARVVSTLSLEAVWLLNRAVSAASKIWLW